MYYDWTYILVLIGALLSMLASMRVQRTYDKYARVRSARGLTGREVANYILQTNNVQGVTVQHVSGSLTDHYNPTNGTVNLSDVVYGSASVAALGVAAHECGYVM